MINRKMKKMCGNILKDEKGLVVVIVAVVMTVLIGFSAFVVDVGTVSLEKQKFQNAIDAACLAGAQDLPDTSAATIAANNYVQLNGYQPSDISITFSDANHKINITGIKEVSYTFAKVLGLQSTNVNTVAAALKESLGGAFDYALFSGSQSTTLTLNGSSMYVGGSSHTNKNFVANGSNITITGACEAMGTITVNGSSIHIDNRIPNASFVAMPDFSETIRLQAEAAGQVYTGNKTYNGSSMVVDQSIYVNGNVTVNGSHFVGKGCVLATGNITFNGSNLNASTTDAVCFYSKNGNIIVNGSSAVFDGILYAPNGSITMNGSSQTVNGRVIGKTVTINGSSLTIQSGTNELQSLPSGSIRLVK
jgi:Flp pilus assembly protein TadG